MGAIISALAGSLFTLMTTVLQFILQSVVIKFVVFFVLFFVVTEFFDLLTSIIPEFDIDGLMADISSGGAYFINLFKIDEGVSLILTAYIYRFAIRRIPLLG